MIEQQATIVRFQSLNPLKCSKSQSLPWLQSVSEPTGDPLLRLHNQMVQFYLFLLPEKEEQAVKQATYKIVQKTILDYDSSLEVTAPFLPTRMYLKGTELEVFIVGDMSREQLFALGDWASAREAGRKESAAERRVRVNDCAVVLHRVEAEWSDYLKALQESFQYIHEFKFLYFVVTCMSRQRAMHLDIPSSLVAGILSAFYYERRKQRTRTLSENILKFLEYFGVGLFQERQINYLGRNRFEVVVQNTQPMCFSFWVTDKSNLSTPTVRELFALFKNRYRILSNYNFVEEQSILSWLVNPSLTPFVYL